MKALTTAGLTKLIQLIKSSFIKTTDTVTTNTVTLADVATSGDYDDLINQPTIGNGTITFTQGGVTKGTITTNQSGDTTIALDAGGGGGAVDSVNGQTGTVVLTASDVGALADTTTIPSKTSDLTNDSGFITGSALNGYATETWVGNQGYLTGITSSDVVTALTYTPYNGATNPNGYITSADLPTNYVTTDTVQDITAKKTFIGDKAINFKQSTTADKLGFTLYNTSNTELAAFEFRPSTIGSSALFNLNLQKTSANYVGFRYHGTNAINVACPKVATAGNYYIPINFTDGTNTVTATNVGTVNISSLLPDISTKQDTLVSGTNIKTINNTSLLGSGNIDTSEIFIAKYNVTTFQQVSNAYSTGKTIVCDLSPFRCLTITYDPTLRQFVFSGVSINNLSDTGILLYYIILNSSDNWSIVQKQLANTDLSNLSTTGQAVIDGKVSKSGDTMTGDLILENACVMQREVAIKGTSPSQNIYWGFNFCDSQGTAVVNRIGTIESSYTSEGATRTDILVYEPTNDSRNNAKIRVGYTSNKVAYCEFPDTTCVDGEWKSADYAQVINTATSVNGSSRLPYGLSSILPNDNYDYLVDFAAEGRTGATSGNFFNIRISSDIGGARTIVRAQTRSNSAVYAGGFCSMPVSTSRQIYLDRGTSWNGEVQGLWVCGYRRLGTNS